MHALSTYQLETDDAARLADVKALLSVSAGLPLDPRMSTLLELVGSNDGAYERGGLTYSVDGDDVSVSWGGGARPDRTLYLLAASEVLLVLPGGDELARFTVKEALAEPYRLVELSEELGPI